MSLLLLTAVLAFMSAGASAQGSASTPVAPQGGTPAGVLATKSTYDEAITRARALLKEGKPKESLAVSEQAIALDDKRWEAYVTAASAYASAQLFDDAVGMLQLALPRAPEDRKPLIRDALTEVRRALLTPAPAAVEAAPAEAEIVLWKTIENTSKPEDLEAYLKAYPNGIFAPIAAARADALEWAAIRYSTKPADFDRYLRLFPQGRYAQEAKSTSEELAWNAARLSSDSSALQRFIDAYPSSRFKGSAVQRYDELIAEEMPKKKAAEAALKKQAAGLDPTGEAWQGEFVTSKDTAKVQVQFTTVNELAWASTEMPKDYSHFFGALRGSWAVSVDELTVVIFSLNYYWTKPFFGDSERRDRDCIFRGTLLPHGDITLRSSSDGCSRDVLTLRRP